MTSLNVCDYDFVNLTSFNSEQNLTGIVAKFDQLGFDHKHLAGQL